MDIPLPDDEIDLTVLDRARLLCSDEPLPSLPSLAQRQQIKQLSEEEQIVREAIQTLSFDPFENPQDVRNLIVNKLIIESQLAVDPKIRLRSLELLGKSSQVDLFKESKEITITHRSTSEIEEKLKAKLEKYMGAIETVDYAAI